MLRKREHLLCAIINRPENGRSSDFFRCHLNFTSIVIRRFLLAQRQFVVAKGEHDFRVEKRLIIVNESDVVTLPDVNRSADVKKIFWIVYWPDLKALLGNISKSLPPHIEWQTLINTAKTTSRNINRCLNTSTAARTMQARFRKLFLKPIFGSKVQT